MASCQNCNSVKDNDRAKFRPDPIWNDGAVFEKGEQEEEQEQDE